MGLTYVRGEVEGPKGKSAPVEFLVDSGAKWSLLPRKVWKAIGLVPARTVTFILADGTRLDRRLSDCWVHLPQGKTHSTVVLGEKGDDQALLGVVTLENMGLILDPFHRTLEPIRLVNA